MRLDDVAPRTLLLGAVAGWALLAWALALAGMGGHLPEGESGAIEGSRLPTLPKGEATPALGPYSQYAEISARPLLATDRRPHAFSIGQPNGKSDAPPDFDLVLTSVLISPQARIAIVQKPDGSAYWRVKVGEAPESQPGWMLTELAPRSAVFEGPGGRKELALRIFDGKGGAAPGAPTGLPVDPAPTMGGAAPPPPPAPPAT
ncbi:type II secretion system protein XpsN, partial [Lysobacter xanthus]